MVADLCHVVKASFRGENTKRRHAKTRQMVTFSCFRMAIFRPATRKYATFYALRFRLLFVVSLPGGAKGRHAKTRQNHHLAGFRMATFRVFALKTCLYDMAQISHHKVVIHMLYKDHYCKQTNTTLITFPKKPHNAYRSTFFKFRSLVA